ncbi:MAG: hypothetical protein ACR2H4_18835 [Pyrinomonadaceae bacterium]
MRYVTTALFVLLVCMIRLADCQESKQKRRSVIVPPNAVLTVIANQPDCPLKFESATIVAYLDGGGGEVYQLRNQGAKPIRAYRIAAWNSAGTGFMTDWPRRTTSERLMPGQTSPLPGEETCVEVIPLTEELYKKFNFYGPMKAVEVFMVVRVEFADGSVYSDESTFKALQDYFEKVGARVVVN